MTQNETDILPAKSCQIFFVGRNFSHAAKCSAFLFQFCERQENRAAHPARPITAPSDQLSELNSGSPGLDLDWRHERNYA